MSSISATITSNLDKKIEKFIDALSEQLSIEKDELYEIFNGLTSSDDESVDEVSDSSLENDEDDEEEKIIPKPVSPVLQEKTTKKDKKEEKKVDSCEYVYIKGKNAGEKCPTKVNGTRFCKKHAGQEREETVETKKVEVKPVEVVAVSKDGKCEYVFSKGKTAGERCTANVDGTRFCKKHSKEGNEPKVEKKEAKKESKEKKTNKKEDKEQKDKETINRLVDSNLASKSENKKEEKVVKKGEPVLSLSRNRFGNFEMPDTGFVFDPKTRQVIGTQNEDGTINDLTVDDIELCKEYGFHNVKVPEKLKSNVVHSSDDEDLDDEILDSDEFEDDDDDEDDEDGYEEESD